MPTTTGVATEFITFTRASNATVTDSDGKVKWAPANLLTNSESFDNAAWGKYLATVSANTQAAPNGTTTADTVTASAGNDVHRVQRASDVAIGASANASLSIFVKAGTHNFVTIGFYSATEVFVSATFNLASGSAATETDVGTTSGTVVSTEKVDVGTGWYRLTITGNYSGSTALSFVNFAQAATGNSYTNFGQPVANLVGTETFHLWGASLYRSDLGGMQPNTSAYPMYNPTTPKNLLGFTEDFSNAAWSKGATTVTADTSISPFGLQTADTLTETSASSGHTVSISATVSTGTYTFSAYLKKGSGATAPNWMQLYVGGGSVSYANFNLATGAYGSVYAGSTASITPVGSSGWYRCSVTFPSSSGSAALVIAFTNNTDTTTRGLSYAGATTSDVLVWGAQLSDSASLDSYVPVYGAAVTSAAYYGPRRDFDPVTLACKGLLVEEQRVNTIVGSANFSGGGTGWVLDGPSLTASATAGPDGSLSATSIVQGTGNNRTYQFDNSSVTGSKVFSIYVKPNAGSSLSITAVGGMSPNGPAVINATTGSVTGFTGASSVAVGNGWYRVYLPVTVTVASGGGTYWVISGPASSVFIWGTQLEAGTFATSYIPTPTAATATRNADVASVSTQAFPYSATEGSIVVNASSPCIAAIANMITLDNGTTQERIRLLTDVASVKTIVTQSNTTQANLSPGSATANTPFKFSVAYKVNDFAAVVNGSAAATYPTGNVPVVNIARLGADSSGNYLNGHIRQITYLPRRISNTELQTRTA